MKSIVLPLLCHLQGLANSENLSTSWQPPARTEAGLWAAWFGNIAGIWYSYLLCKSANMTGTSQNRRQALKENWAVCCNKNKDCSDLTHFGVTAFTHHSDFLFEKRQSVAKYKVQNSLKEWHLPLANRTPAALLAIWNHSPGLSPVWTIFFFSKTHLRQVPTEQPALCTSAAVICCEEFCV